MTRRAHWSRRALIGVGLCAAGAGVAGVGALAFRDGGDLVTGRARARAVTGDVDLPSHVDVVVIGGGNIGCMTALHLAERGVSVAVCEKGVIAGEASGRSLGSIDSILLDPVKAPMVSRSKQLWEGMNARLESETGYRKVGFSALFTSEAAIGMSEAWVQSLQGEPGSDARMLSAAEAAQVAVGGAVPYLGGVQVPSDAMAEPQLFAPALADAVRRHGGVVLQQCAVRGLDMSAGRVSGVVTERGPIACEAVVLAGGAWSPMFAGALGLDLPQFMAFSGVTRLGPANGPAPATCLLSEPQGIVMRRTLDGHYDTCVPEASAPVTADAMMNLPRLWPAMQGLGSQIRPVLSASTFASQFRLSRTWDLDEISPFEKNRILEPETRMDLSQRSVDGAVEAFPSLRGVDVVERWSGALTTTIDNMPVLSAVPTTPGLYLGSGFYFGLTMAPAAGEALADLVMGNTPQLDVDLYRFGRFSDGSPIVFRP